MKTFHIDCELNYDVVQQTLFVFNIGAPSSATQQVRAESLNAHPRVAIDEFQAEEEEHADDLADLLKGLPKDIKRYRD